jgi:hypothetical protein
MSHRQILAPRIGRVHADCSAASEAIGLHHPATCGHETAQRKSNLGRDDPVNSVNASQRLAAIAMAIGITFCIVAGLSDYAHAKLEVSAQAKSCS